MAFETPEQQESDGAQQNPVDKDGSINIKQLTVNVRGGGKMPVYERRPGQLADEKGMVDAESRKAISAFLKNIG